MGSFLIATIAFALTPGPAMLYSISYALAFGRSDGMKAVLGIHVATYVHISLAAAGLSVLFRDLPFLLLALKVVGCGYLGFLGLTTLLRAGTEEAYAGASPTGANRRPVAEAFLAELLNPKTALFFFAFLPQFADPAVNMPIWLQVLLLGIAANATFSLSEVLSVLLAQTALATLSTSPGRRKLATWLSGLVLITLGLYLALEQI